MSHISAKLAFVMLGIRANQTSEEQLLDELINELTEYKLLGCPKDNRPMMAITSVQLKWSGKADSINDLLKTTDEIDRISAINDTLTSN